MHDLLVIIWLSLVSCLVVGVTGAVLLRALRTRPLATTLIVAGLVPMAAVAAAVVVSVRRMFISPHDSTVVLTALACAVVVAAAMSLLVARWVAAGSRALAARLRGVTGEQLAAGSLEFAAALPAPVSAAPAELADVERELEAMRLRLAESHRRERALERSRRELVAFLSHDLRTPLTGLRALAEGLEDGVIRDVPAALQRMVASVDRMGSLVDDLFELARVTAPREHERELVSLSELAADVISETSDHARARRVELLLVLDDPADRLPVLGHGDELARALTNLIGNAVRHSPGGTAVRVDVGRGADGRVRLGVTDSCGGIPADQIDRVFDVGWRASPERTPDGGAGLGLAIARGVAENHEGTVDVRNVEGGCRFDLALPAPAGAPAPAG